MLNFSRPAERFPAALLLAVCVLTSSSRNSFAQETKGAAGEGEPNQSNPATQGAANPFVIPEGTDAKALQGFLNRLMETPSLDRSPAGRRAHFNKLHDLAEQVFQREIDEETSLLAMSLISGSLGALEQFGDQTAAERHSKFLEELKQDKRPKLAMYGRLLDVQGQIAHLNPEDKPAQHALVTRVTQLLQEPTLTIDHARVAFDTISALEAASEPQLVENAAKIFAVLLRAPGDEVLQGEADILEGTARRMSLKGKPVQISGPTVGGDDFNIEQWKGKVVIVDFWATWCGVCVAELPALQELYEAHHEQGLEIVGVSLDDSRRLLESFLHERQIPWTTLFIDPEGKEKWDNPLAKFYGIVELPTMFLVGRDGKVVATDLFGDELREAAVKLMKAK